MMVEAGANEVSEEKMLEAILFAHEEIKNRRLYRRYRRGSRQGKTEYKLYLPSDEMTADVEAFVGDGMHEAVHTPDKVERLENIAKVKDSVQAQFMEKYPDGRNDLDAVLTKLQKKEVRSLILDDRIRPTTVR